MISNVEIGKRLKDLRENVDTEGGKPCSQDKLIELLHLEISQNMLSNIERGKTAAPLDVLVKYSEHFGVSLDKLITGKDFTPPAKEKKQETFADILRAIFFIDKHYPMIIKIDDTDSSPFIPGAVSVSIKFRDAFFEETGPIRKSLINQFFYEWDGIRNSNIPIKSKNKVLSDYVDTVLEEGENFTPDFKDISTSNPITHDYEAYLSSLVEIRNEFYRKKKEEQDEIDRSFENYM